MPGDSFIIFISKLGNIFDSSFEEIATSVGILKTLLELSDHVLFDHPCCNFPLTFVKKLYFRLRIYYSIKYINRNFKDRSNKDKLLIWKNQ